MESLLVVAHGSRRQASNEEVISNVTLFKNCYAKEVDIVLTAFLELAEPTIPDSIDCLVRLGSRKITVLPYFLAAGTHVVKDVPAIINEMKRKYPHVEFVITPHIGSADVIIAALERLVDKVEFSQAS